MRHTLPNTSPFKPQLVLLAALSCLAGALPAPGVGAESLESYLPDEIEGMIHTDRAMGVAHAIETTGKPGAPDATTTIDGRQLPPPPDKKFGGKIERNAVDSEPYWPPRVVPPDGAPNVLLIMTDDSGYGVPSTFGGVIPTPALDRIAENGLRSRTSTPRRCAPPLAQRS